MVKNRSTQQKKRDLAAKMIGLGMRASIIASVFDLPLSQARALYVEITGRSSPSGQKPRSDEYYFRPIMRIHSSLFMVFHRYIAATGVDVRSAMASAYEQYSKACQGETKLPIDRAWHLIVLFEKKDGVVRETHCAACGSYSLIEAWEAVAKYRCPHCTGSLGISQRLRGRSGRKRKSALESSTSIPVSECTS